jgi:hypothetical protein
VSEEPEDLVPTEEELPEAYSSPLHILLSEMHEIYQELLVVGFPDRVATMIVAHMIQDAMLYRPSDEDDDDNDGQDEIDDDNRGPL